jgi:hypothetical protein
MPAFQFYPGDWWKDPGIKMLTLEERGFWFQLLLLMHESPRRGFLEINGKPMPESGIAMVMGLDNQKVNHIVNHLTNLGVVSVEDGTGILFSRRMVRDEVLLEARRNAGKLGGNPALVKDVVNHKPTSRVNQNPTPSSSSASSTSSSDDINKKPSSIDEVKFYGEKIGLPAIECEKFFNHFSSNGWKVGGKAPMKNWQAAVRNWKLNWQSKPGAMPNPKKLGWVPDALPDVQ